MNIIALDPSFTETGWCIGKYEDEWSVIDGGCIKTRSKASEGGVTKTQDQTRRIRFITRELTDCINEYDTGLVTAEYQPGWTSKQVAKSSGMLISCITCCAYFNNDLPIQWYQPSEVKKIILGKNSGTKKEIREELEKKYEDLTEYYGGTKYQTEAVGDAAAVLECAVQRSELVKALT